MIHQPLKNSESSNFEMTANSDEKLKPLVFDPNIEDKKYTPVSDTELNNLENDDINDRANVWSRLYRMVFILIINLIFLPITAIFKDELHIFTILGFAVLCCSVAYSIHLYYIVFKAYFSKKNGLYRVHTLNSIPPNWAEMSIAYRALLLEHQPIESISEFSAIQGKLYLNV